MAMKWPPAWAGPTARFTRSKKYWNSAFGSSVVPDLLDTMNSVFANKKPVDSGIGWTLVDKDHNLPASGEFIPPVDFQAQYKAAWGVG